MTYILTIIIIHAAIGATDVQRQSGFASYADCATHAVASVDSLQAISPDDVEIRWQCSAAH
jgi:hypothetical protein